MSVASHSRRPGQRLETTRDEKKEEMERDSFTNDFDAESDSESTHDADVDSLPVPSLFMSETPEVSETDLPPVLVETLPKERVGVERTTPRCSRDLCWVGPTAVRGGSTAGSSNSHDYASTEEGNPVAMASDAEYVYAQQNTVFELSMFPESIQETSRVSPGSVQDDYLCPVCHVTDVQISLCPCGHQCCRKCIGATSTVCKVCSREFTSSLPFDAAAARRT